MENANNKPKPVSHWFGFVLGLLLATIIAFGVLVLPKVGYALIVMLPAAVLVGVSLLIANFVLSVKFACRGEPLRPYLMQWCAPVMVAFFVLAMQA